MQPSPPHSADRLAIYVANEGRFVAIVPETQDEAALDLMCRHAISGNAARIGTVTEHYASSVILRTVLGTHRILDLLSGEQLPRIC